MATVGRCAGDVLVWTSRSRTLSRQAVSVARTQTIHVVRAPNTRDRRTGASAVDPTALRIAGRNWPVSRAYSHPWHSVGAGPHLSAHPAMHLVTRLARRLVTLFALGLVSILGGRTLSAQPQADSADGLTSGPLFNALARMDSILFDASFGSCDAAKANAIFAADVEFYHDQTGFAAGEQVRENTRRLTAGCPRGHGITRSVVPGSLRVYPVANYGAVQMGTHRFDERGAPTSTLTRFVHVWHLENGEWRLARVFSLDHHAVPPVQPLEPR